MLQIKKLTIFIMNFAIYLLKNSKRYYISIVVGGIAWSASSEVNKAESGEREEVYYQDHVLSIIFIACKHDLRVQHTYLHFVCTL